MPLNTDPARGLTVAGPDRPASAATPAVALALATLALAGCSWLPHRHREPAAPPVVQSAAPRAAVSAAPGLHVLRHVPPAGHRGSGCAELGRRV